MLRARRAMAAGVFDRRREYWERVNTLVRSFPLGAQWPLDETSGTAAIDLVNGWNGVHTNTTLANALGPSGKLIVYANGTNAYVNNTNAAFLAAFGSTAQAEGGAGGWFKADTGVWDDNTGRLMFYLFKDSSNVSSVSKNADNSLVAQMVRGGTSSTSTIGVRKPAGFSHYYITWSEANNRFRFYINGQKIYETTLGTWSGGLTQLVVMNGGGTRWKGWGDMFTLVGGREPTATEIAILCSATKIYRLTVLGDSISAAAANHGDWPWITAYGWQSGLSIVKNYATASMGVVEGVTNMAAQAILAASDNADRIIVALGANDNNGGNMTTLQAAYEAGIVAMKASNTQATIYAMNVPTLWTDSGGGTEIDKGNIRTAIAAAGAAQGITVVDTTDWRLSSDTGDGTHNIASGHAKFAAEWVALL